MTTNNDAREEYIESNPKNLSTETQLVLVDIMTDFATEMLNSKLDNEEAATIWNFVRKIFKQYGLK